MATYVEQAILQITDRSTKPVNAVNAALRRLMQTANRMKRVDVGGFVNTSRTVNDLVRQLERLGRMRIAPTFNLAGGAREINDLISRLDRLDNRRISVAVDFPGAAELNALLARIARADAEAINIAVDFSRITAASAAVNRLIADLARLRGADGGRPGGPDGRPTGDPDGRPAGGPAGQERSGDFYRNASFEIQGEIYIAARQVVLTGANAALDQQDAELRAAVILGAGRDPAVLPDGSTRAPTQAEAQLAALLVAAEVSSGRYPAIPEHLILDAAAEGVASQGLTDPAAIQRYTDAMAAQAFAFMNFAGVSPEVAMQEARLGEKVINNLGAQNDPVRAQQFRDNQLRGYIATGGEIGGAEAVRIAQRAEQAKVNMTPEAMLFNALARDEGGARATGAYDQFLSDLARGNLNVADMALQMERGIRNEDGTPTDFANVAAADPIGTIHQLRAMALAAGVDLDDPAAVMSYLDNTIGLSKQAGITMMANSIANLDVMEAEFARAMNANLDALKPGAVDQFGEPVQTTRMAYAGLVGSYRSVMGEALAGGLGDVINEWLSTATATLSSINQDGWTAANIADVMEAAGVVALGALLPNIVSGEATVAEIQGAVLITTLLGVKAAVDALTGWLNIQDRTVSEVVSEGVTATTGLMTDSISASGEIGRRGLAFLSGVPEAVAATTDDMTDSISIGAEPGRIALDFISDFLNGLFGGDKDSGKGQGQSKRTFELGDSSIATLAAVMKMKDTARQADVDVIRRELSAQYLSEIFPTLGLSEPSWLHQAIEEIEMSQEPEEPALFQTAKELTAARQQWEHLMLARPGNSEIEAGLKEAARPVSDSILAIGPMLESAMTAAMQAFSGGMASVLSTGAAQMGAAITSAIAGATVGVRATVAVAPTPAADLGGNGPF